METYKRKYIRYPIYQPLKILCVGTRSPKKTVIVTFLRDESHTGFGTVFVGESIPETTNSFYVIEGNEMYRKVKLVWVKELYRNVFLLGFEKE